VRQRFLTHHAAARGQHHNNALWCVMLQHTRPLFHVITGSQGQCTVRESMETWIYGSLGAHWYTGHWALSSLHVHTHGGALACAGLHSPCPTSPPTAHRFKYQSSLFILEVLPIFLQTNIQTPKRRPHSQCPVTVLAR
jgi:hypothetical protein